MDLFDIRVDDVTGHDVLALLREHLAGMHRDSPPGHVHALDVEALRAPSVTFWTVWAEQGLAGCGALQELEPTHGEIKSMRTATPFLRRGVAGALLAHIVRAARVRGYQRLSLETGATEPFAPAHALYARFGFERCGPFADYAADDFSVFMTRKL